jgi:mannose-6-phosphate isomerase-like protein (cupin superfamily)
MTEPMALKPEPELSVPEGVAMWMLEKGKTLPADCPVSAARFVVEPGATTDLDVHEVVEVWTVMSGSGTLLSADRRMRISTGDSTFFASNVPHQLVNDGDMPVEVFSIWWSRTGR